MSNFEDDLLNDDVQWKDTLDDELDIDEEEALLRVSDDETLDRDLVDCSISGTEVEYVDEEGNVVDMTENENVELYEVREYSQSEEDGILCLTQDDDILDVNIDGDIDGTQENELLGGGVDYDAAESSNTPEVASTPKSFRSNSETISTVPQYSVIGLNEILNSTEPTTVIPSEEQTQESEQPPQDMPDASEKSPTEDRETKDTPLEDESDDEDDDRRERFRSERKSVVLITGTKRRTDIPDSLDAVIPVEESAKVDEFLAKERERKLQRKGIFRGRPPFRGGLPPRQPVPCVVPLMPSGNKEIPIQPVHPTPQHHNQHQNQQHFPHISNAVSSFHFDDSPEHFSPDAHSSHGGRKILINPHFKGPRPSVSQGILPHPVNNPPFREPLYNEPQFADMPPHLRGPPPMNSPNFRNFRDGPPNNMLLNQRPPLAFRNFNPRYPPPMRERPSLNNFDRPSSSGSFRHPPRSMGPPLMSEIQGPRFLGVQRLPPVQQMHSVEIPGNLYTPFDSSPPNKCHPPLSESWGMPPNHHHSPHHMQEMSPHQHSNQHFQHRPPFPSNSNMPDHQNPPFGGFQPRPPFSPEFNSPGNISDAPHIRNHLPPSRPAPSEFHPPNTPNVHNPPHGVRPLIEMPPSFQMNSQTAMETKPPPNQQPVFQNFNDNNRNQMFGGPQQTSPPQPQPQFPPVLNQVGSSPVGQKRPHPGFQNQTSPIKQARIEARKPIRKNIPNVRKPAVRSSNIKEVPLSESLPVAATSTLTVPQPTPVVPVKASVTNNTNHPEEKPDESETFPKEEEEEDPETKELRRKIEEQKRLREEIIRRKEERRRQMAAQRLKDLQERMKEQEQNKIPVTVKHCPTPSITQQNVINTPQLKPSVKYRLGYIGHMNPSLPMQQVLPGMKKRIIVVRKKVPPGPGLNPQSQTGQLTQNLLSASAMQTLKAGQQQAAVQRSVLAANSQVGQVKNLQTTKVLEHIKQMSQTQSRLNMISPLQLNKTRIFPPNRITPNNFSAVATKNVVTGKVLQRQPLQPQRTTQPQVKMLSTSQTQKPMTVSQHPKLAPTLQTQKPLVMASQPQKLISNPQQQKRAAAVPPQNTALDNLQRSALTVGRGLSRGVIPQKVIRLSAPPGGANRPQFRPPQQLQQQRPVQPLQANRAPAPTVPTANPTPPPVPRSRRVLVENLAASTSEAQLSKLCTSVGPVQSIQMQSADRKAVVTFNNPLHAMQFHKKYQRFMLDLSMIQVSLMVS